MKQMKKKLSLILIMALIIGTFGNVIMASAATKSSWSFETKSGITVDVGKTIHMEKNEFQDFNLYKSGKEIKQTDSRYQVTWSSDDETVIWIDAKNGKARADKFGDMKGDYGEAVITAKIKNKTTKAIAYRKFNVVVGEEEQKPTKAPTAPPTPTPTKAPEAPKAASIALQFKDQKIDPSQTLEPNYTYSLETRVYDDAGKEISSNDLTLYFKYFSNKDGITFTGADFKAIKEGEYTITVGAYKTEAEAKNATSAKDALFTAELKNLVVQAGAPIITHIQQLTMDTVRLTMNTADYAKKLAESSKLLKVKRTTGGYSYSVPVSSITQDKEDPCSVNVLMRSRLASDSEYTYFYEGYEDYAVLLIGSDTTPAFIELVGGPVEAQAYYQFDVKIYSSRGVDISNVTYYNLRFKALDSNILDFSYQLSGDRIWFTTEGKSAVIEATLDLGYDNKGNRLPELTSVAQFYSIPKAQPIYTSAERFAVADNQSILTPAKLNYNVTPQTICLGDTDDTDLYIAAAFNYIDEKKNESTQYIAAGKDTTGNNYTYTYYSADTSILLVGRANGSLVPIQTGSTAVYVYQYKEYPIDENKGEVVAVIPITIAPERALETFSITEQSSVSMSTTGSIAGDEYITMKLRALDQQGTPVDAKYTFSVVEPAGAVFSSLFNYSTDNGVLKIWEGAGLNSFVSKDIPKNIIVTVTASYNNVQRQQNFQLVVRNTKGSTVYSSELFLSNPRVDLKLDSANEDAYTSTVQVRSIDNNGYFIRLENLSRISSISQASTANGAYSIMITNAIDDSNAEKLKVETSEKEIKIKLVNTSDNVISKEATGVYKITLYRGNGNDAIPVAVKGLEVVDTSSPISVVQNKFSLLSPDSGSVKDALTILRGTTDITEYVMIDDMKKIHVDSILVVYELYAKISAQEQNKEWGKDLHTSVTIPLETPLQFTIGQ